MVAPSHHDSALGPEIAWDGPVVYRGSVGSTMDLARELARAGCPQHTLIVADAQTAGRGRQGRSWTAPAGLALALSIVLRPLPAGFERIPFACAVATAEAAEGQGARRCGIKWPNDVVVGDRKIAGAIVESRIGEGWAVAGIGLNANVPPDRFPPGIRRTATSLSQVCGHGVDRRSVLASLLDRLAHWLGRLDPGHALLEEVRSRDSLSGRDIAWEEGGRLRRGTALGIADSGGLRIVESDGPERELRSGEVHLTRSDGAAK